MSGTQQPVAPTTAVPAPRHAPVALLMRGGAVESVHYGSIVIVNGEGTPQLSVGEPDAVCYPRSALKPVQVSAMVRSGLALPLDLLALATSSHSGEAPHISGVRRLLATFHLWEEHLRNPRALPFGTNARDKWVRAGGEPCRVAHNCSGKHAAMLATARANGWSLASYLDSDHPVQREIARTAEELANEPIAHTAVDECGAPLLSLSLTGLTRAFSTIATAGLDTAEGRVAAAMRAHPLLIGGTRRFVTRLMHSVPNLIAKDGVEGVCVAALPDGTAVGVKISDGARRALTPVVAAALVACGIDRHQFGALLPDGRVDGVCAAFQ